MNEYDLKHERMVNAMTRIRQAELRTRNDAITGSERQKLEALRKLAAEVRNALTELGSI